MFGRKTTETHATVLEVKPVSTNILPPQVLPRAFFGEKAPDFSTPTGIYCEGRFLCEDGTIVILYFNAHRAEKLHGNQRGILRYRNDKLLSFTAA